MLWTVKDEVGSAVRRRRVPKLVRATCCRVRRDEINWAVMKTLSLFVVVYAISLYSTIAIGPQELLVVANDRSEDSMAVARRFMDLRSVPEENLVTVHIPYPRQGGPFGISTNRFTTLIWEPIMRQIQERGLEDRILAWAYSLDFPYLVNTDPPISIQGITYMRNRLPSTNDVRYGTLASPLFAGPVTADGIAYMAQTFDAYADWLGEDMPIPSMMLGVVDDVGSTVTSVVACLERGLASDGTNPTGTIYLVKTSDIRSTCRHWQYDPLVPEIRDMGVAVEILDNEPEGKTDVIGLQMGAAIVFPATNRYLPGAMTEHLTSAAGAFYGRTQTKLTRWIDAGATASAGTVTEPFALWQKFPNVRFYSHYIAGCTMIESFYQSIRCPLQILLVGDPLAAPWAPMQPLRLEGATNRISGTVSIRPDMDLSEHFRDFEYYLDGKLVDRGDVYKVVGSDLAEGHHRLRVVARGRGLVRPQRFALWNFVVEPKAVEASGEESE